MTRLRILLAIAATTLLQACLAPTADQQTQATTVAATQSRTFVFSWAMFADPVFERDVLTFNRTFAAQFGAPQAAASYAFASRRFAEPDPDSMRETLEQMAQDAVDGEDTVVIMLTSHGAPGVLAVKTSADGPVAAVSADGLAEFLAPLSQDQQIIILQACFSGSLIDRLKSPNRIILTAAAADRTSFGCEPDSDNTWFIKSLNRAIGMGGSWQQIFNRTRALVEQEEARAGFPGSNPQSNVGRNMRLIWTANAT